MSSMLPKNLSSQFDEETLKKIQFHFLAGFAQHGQYILYDIQNIITPDCLVNTKGKFFYEVILTILENGFDVTDITFESHCDILGYTQYFQANKVELLDNLNLILGVKVSQKLAVEYACILARRHFKHNTLNELNALKEHINNLPDNIESDNISAALIEFLRKNETHSNRSELKLISEGIEDHIQDIIEGVPGIPGIETGFPLIEQMVGGIDRGTVTCICSRTGIGKSAMSLNMALHAAKTGLPVLYMDLEMREKEVKDRMLSNLGQIILNNIKFRQIEEGTDDSERLRKAGEFLKTLNITWKNVADMSSIEKCLAYAKRWLAKVVGFNEYGKANPCLVVYDYIKYPGDKFHEIGRMANILKIFSVHNDVPIITATQLNREALKDDAANNGLKVFGSDQVLHYFDSVFMYKRKTDIEKAQDNADYGPENGNSCVIPMKTRNNEEWDKDDYISIQYEGRFMTLTEIARRSTYRKAHDKTPKIKKPKEESKIV